MAVDRYLTINAPAEGYFRDRGSRFHSFAHPVNTEYEIQQILLKIHKDYHDARHYCYAWRLGAEKKHFRSNDDGEPSNSAGKPILGQILAYDLTNILIVVVRYFGGTLLGVGGLVRAYKTAASEAIKNAAIINKFVTSVYKLDFKYEHLNSVMKIIKASQLEYQNEKIGDNCEIIIKILKPDEKILSDRFKAFGSLDPIPPEGINSH